MFEEPSLCPEAKSLVILAYVRAPNVTMTRHCSSEMLGKGDRVRSHYQRVRRSRFQLLKEAENIAITTLSKYISWVYPITCNKL